MKSPSVAFINACTPAVNELSTLTYVDVTVIYSDYDVKFVKSLCDSGAEICVIRPKSSVVKHLASITVGQIQLRPFCV